MAGCPSVEVLCIKLGNLLALRMLHLSAKLQKRLFYVMVGPVGSRLNIDVKLPAALEPKFSKVGFHLIKVTCRPLLLAKQ